MTDPTLTSTIARLRELEAKARKFSNEEGDRLRWRDYTDALEAAAPALLDAAERAEQADVDRIVAVVMRKDAEAERVLHAIRVPDERVLEAMDAALRDSFINGETPKENALAVWQAGIDAIARPEAK